MICNDLQFVKSWIYLYTIDWNKSKVTGITAYKWRLSNVLYHSLRRNGCIQRNFFTKPLAPSASAVTPKPQGLYSESWHSFLILLFYGRIHFIILCHFGKQLRHIFLPLYRCHFQSFLCDCIITEGGETRGNAVYMELPFSTVDDVARESLCGMS